MPPPAPDHPPPRTPARAAPRAPRAPRAHRWAPTLGLALALAGAPAHAAEAARAAPEDAGEPGTSAVPGALGTGVQLPGDVGAALALLREPTAVDRARGERWLAAHLGRADFDAVAETLRGADAEVRARVVRALASDGRHLGLAAQLAVDYDPPVSRAGDAALRALAERWATADPGEPFQPLANDAVTTKLVERFTYSWSLALPAASLHRAVDRLVRVGLGAELVFSRSESVQIALAPELFAEERELLAERDPLTLRLPEGAARPSGPLAGLLDELRRFHGVRLEGFGFGGPAPWILVAPRGEVGRFTPEERLARWCAQVLQHSERPLGEGAARALASTGWPAAVEWLEQRWLEAGDRNALAGLLVAAGRGAVAPGIATAAFVRDVLRRADDALRAGSVVALSFATDVQRGLASFGAAGAAGEDLLAPLLAGLDGAPPQGRWLRLAVLERWRLVPAALRAQLAEALLAPAGEWRDADLRLQALRTLAADPAPFRDADGGGPPRAGEPRALAGRAPATPAALFAAARTMGEREVVLEALERLRLRPPEDWREPGGDGAFPRAPHWVFEWWLQCDETATAARHLRGLLRRGDETAVRLLERRLSLRAESGQRGRVRAVLDAARPELAGEALARLDLVALETDCIPADVEAAALRGALEDPGTDVLLLGALAGRPGGEEALERVLGRLEASLGVTGPRGRPTRELQAAERALVGLVRGGLYEAAGEAEDAVRRLFREADHPYYGFLALGAWPPRPGLRPREVEALDPGLDEIWAGR